MVEWKFIVITDPTNLVHAVEEKLQILVTDAIHATRKRGTIDKPNTQGGRQLQHKADAYRTAGDRTRHNTKGSDRDGPVCSNRSVQQQEPQ